MIQIDLNEANIVPGEPIAGTVTWSGLDGKTTRLEVRLIWYTAGKGDTDVEVVLSNEIDSPTPSGKTDFQFIAPTRPFSFSSKLISLTWAVEVVEFPSRDGVKKTLILSQDRTEIILDNSFKNQNKKAFFRAGSN